MCEAISLPHSSPLLHHVAVSNSKWAIETFWSSNHGHTRRDTVQSKGLGTQNAKQWRPSTRKNETRRWLDQGRLITRRWQLGRIKNIEPPCEKPEGRHRTGPGEPNMAGRNPAAAEHRRRSNPINSRCCHAARMPQSRSANEFQANL
jgi:hypothetical protein